MLTAATYNFRHGSPVATQTMQEQDIQIGNDVWLATGVIVLPRTRIGDGSIIAAGSVVKGDIPAMSIVAGTPGKVVSQRTFVDTPGRNPALRIVPSVLSATSRNSADRQPWSLDQVAPLGSRIFWASQTRMALITDAARSLSGLATNWYRPAGRKTNLVAIGAAGPSFPVNFSTRALPMSAQLAEWPNDQSNGRRDVLSLSAGQAHGSAWPSQARQI
eukprot:gene15072-19056_t